MANYPEHLNLMIAMVRSTFALETADEYVAGTHHGFYGLLEWSEWMGWDDGYSHHRFTITRAADTWSDYTGGYDRPVITVTISADSKQLTLPQFDRPLVVPRLAELAARTAVPLDRAPDTHLGKFVKMLMQHHDGENLCELGSTSLAFTVTFDDEPPWVPDTRRRPTDSDG